MSDELLFSPEEEEEQAQEENTQKPWRVLVVDDEPEVFKNTSIVLSDFSFERRPVSLAPAYSAAEAKTILETQEPFAVILLDVVMETTHAGLELARWIRKQSSDNMVRIILRTGQPGESPEEKVIREYDINGYLNKAEATSRKLFSSMYTAIRSYRDMQLIEQNRAGLKKIIAASSELFQKNSFKQLSEGIVTQMIPLFSAHDSLCLFCKNTSAADSADNNLCMGPSDLYCYEILASSGRFKQYKNGSETQLLEKELPVMEFIGRAAAGKESTIDDGKIATFFKAGEDSFLALYSDNYVSLRDIDNEILSLFAQNVKIAFKNITLHQEIIETQKEFIWHLGNVVENRSKDTLEHIRRVSDVSFELAQALGLSDEDSHDISIAAGLHDVGKIGISDDILLKTGAYTTDERKIMQEHSQIGYELLHFSSRPLIQLAGSVAKSHHERWDGKGYPEGLKGEEIPLAARITTLSDVYDALRSKRSYKEAWSLRDVFSFIKKERGTLFDPHLVDIFFELESTLSTMREESIGYSDL